jgi:hypothetical protein
MRIQNVSNYGVSRTQNQQSTFRTNNAVKSNPMSNSNLTFAATFNLKKVVALIRKQNIKGFTAKDAETVLKKLKLDKNVTGGLTGADLLLHAKGVCESTSDRVLSYREFLGRNLSKELPPNVNESKVRGYFESLLKGKAPVFEKRDVQCQYWASMCDKRPQVEYYGEGWKFTDLGAKLIALIKQDKTPKISNLGTFKTNEPLAHTQRGAQREFDNLINSGIWG